jgi:hypothetical protein
MVYAVSSGKLGGPCILGAAVVHRANRGRKVASDLRVFNEAIVKEGLRIRYIQITYTA